MTARILNGKPQIFVYRECARVGHNAYVEPSRVHADLIVRGDADFDRIVPMLAAIIRSRIARHDT